MKNIRKLIFALASFLVLFACSKSDESIQTYSSLVDVSNSALKNDKYKIVTQFSTDGGTTFFDNPTIKIGQSYMIKVIDRTSNGDVDVLSDDHYDFDWSSSNPKPTAGGTEQFAKFVMQKDNTIQVKVVSVLCTYDNSVWAGTWDATESGCCTSTETNVLTQDSVDPNTYVMDNFWGDGVDVSVVFAPYTGSDYFTQTITVPEQTTSEGGVAKGTGFYDQCKGTFYLTVTYDLDGKTNAFDYHFVRKPA